MSQETPYRIAVSLVALGSMVTAGYHHIQAARAGEPVSHREEGPALFWAIRMCGVALFVSMIAYLVAPDAWPWARVRDAWQRQRLRSHCGKWPMACWAAG